jgi:phosphoglycolate phosphatase
VKPHLVIFDMDGTLVDSAAFITEAMRRGFRAAGLPEPADRDTRAIVGLSLGLAVRTMAPGLPDAIADRVVAGYKRAYWQLRAELGVSGDPLFPGARAALDRLASRPGARLGIATGKARRGLDHLVEAHGLGHLFATTQSADEHPSKPDPSMVAACLAETGIPAASAAIVGDTDFDIAMGRAAGIRTIGVTWGFHPPARLRAAGADRIIEGFDALESALASLGIGPHGAGP